MIIPRKAVVIGSILVFSAWAGYTPHSITPPGIVRIGVPPEPIPSKIKITVIPNQGYTCQQDPGGCI